MLTVIVIGPGASAGTGRRYPQNPGKDKQQPQQQLQQACVAVPGAERPSAAPRCWLAGWLPYHCSGLDGKEGTLVLLSYSGASGASEGASWSF